MDNSEGAQISVEENEKRQDSPDRKALYNMYKWHTSQP